MQQFIYKGHEIEIYEGYNGDELFITKDGRKVYSARVHKGDSVSRIKQILG